jgi:hypothetical protein
MTKPDNMHLISEIPEPAAYFAKDRTRWEATKEKVACVGNEHVAVGSGCAAHRKKHVYEPSRYCHRAPQMPGIACAVLADFQLPAAELFVQPPAIRAIARLHV